MSGWNIELANIRISDLTTAQALAAQEAFFPTEGKAISPLVRRIFRAYKLHRQLDKEEGRTP